MEDDIGFYSEEVWMGGGPLEGLGVAPAGQALVPGEVLVKPKKP